MIGHFFLQRMIFVVSFLPLFLFFQFCLTKDVTVMAEYLANKKILKPLLCKDVQGSFNIDTSLAVVSSDMSIYLEKNYLM